MAEKQGEKQGEKTDDAQDPKLLIQILRDYAAGTAPWDEVVKLTQGWQWAQRAPRAEPWGDARLDPPGSFADVEQAYNEDLVSYDEYKQLYGLSRAAVA